MTLFVETPHESPSPIPSIPWLASDDPCAVSTSLPSRILIHCNDLGILLFPLLRLMVDRPQRRQQPQATGTKCHKIGILIAVETIGAGAVSIVADDAMAVEHSAVEQIEDVAGDGGSQRHEAPVLAEPVDSKRLGYDRREDAKQEAVTKTGEPRNEEKEIRVHDVDCEYLREAEDQARSDKAPGATSTNAFHEEVGSDALTMC